MTEVAAPTDGPLSVEQAISAIRAPVEAPEAPAAEPVAEEAPEPEAELAPEPESEAEPTAEDVVEPEAAIDGEEEAPPESEPAKPAIAAPVSWDDAHKARFHELPRDIQELLVAREGERERATFQALQNAAEERKRIDTEAGRVKALADQIDQFLPQAVQTFQYRWGQGPIDWVAVFNEVGSEETTRLKLQYEAETADLQRLAVAQQAAAEETSKRAQETLVAEREVGLRTMAPALCDPAQGTQRRDELATYLLKAGFSQQDIVTSNALQLGMAWKAYQFDQATLSAAALAAKPRSAPATAPRPASPRPAAPSAGQSAPPPRQRVLAEAESRLTRTGRVEDAVAALQARRKG